MRSFIVVAIANIRLQWPYSPESFYSFKKLLAYSDLFCPKLFYAANLLSHAAVTVCVGHLHLGIRLPIWMSVSCPYAQCNYARHSVTYRKQMKPVHSCKGGFLHTHLHHRTCAYRCFSNTSMLELATALLLKAGLVESNTAVHPGSDAQQIRRPASNCWTVPQHA